MNKDVEHFRLSDLPVRLLHKNVTRQVFFGQNGDLGLCVYKKGGIIPVHQHMSEQFSIVANGSLKVTVGDSIFIVKAGEAIVIPPNTPHELEALEDNTYDFHFFSPSVRNLQN